MKSKDIKAHFFLIISISLLSSCSRQSILANDGWMFSLTQREKIVRTAKRYIGVKYKNSGSTPFGFDCSGFVKFVYKKNSINIPRNARDQFTFGKKISLKSAKPGDLVFFKILGKKISHVGIYIGNYKFIHSPSSGKRVSYASIKQTYWKKRFIGTATFFND